MADKAEDVESVQDKLEKAAAGSESESSTEEKPTEAKATEEVVEEASKVSKEVPYERFKEVNDAFKTAKDEWATAETGLKESLQQAQNTSTELTEVIKQGQKDADLVASLRGLAQNPKYSDLIKNVDKALAGLDVEEEKGDKTPEEVADQKHSILESVQEKLTGELEEQRNEILLQRADLIAKDYLSELPEEFNDKDRELVSEMWANRLDWDKVQENPTEMPNLLKTSLEQTLNDYGEPRGKIAQTAAEELEKATEAPPEAPKISIEDQMAKYLTKEYGAVKDDKPVVSDEEFNDDFGKAFKALNDQNRT